jgi:hypothetical protein
MAQKINFTSVDKKAPDREEAERLDLKMQARLDAGLIDTSLASDRVSATQPAPSVEHRPPESPTFLVEAVSSLLNRPC